MRYNICIMEKTLLSYSQAEELVRNNKYLITDSNKYHARCIDGRYENAESLSPLAIAGGDAGQLAILLAASQVYAFDIDLKKAATVLTEIVGGVEKLGLHTDSHADGSTVCSGCGHMKLIRTNPNAYNISPDQVEELQAVIADYEKKGAKEVTLQGDHMEGAVLFVEGNYGVYPQYQMLTEDGTRPVQVFIHHKSLVNQRQRLFAEKLIEAKAVTLTGALDAEYLYEVLSEQGDDHLLETAGKLAHGLPMYGVSFNENGGFKLNDMGPVVGFLEKA